MQTVKKNGHALARGIKPWNVSMIALGGIIGSSYFLGLGGVFSEMGAGAVLIAYAIAGVTIFGVMQSFAELLVNIPRSGSFVAYTREFMGDTASAGIGWAFWASWVCYIPSEALAVATYMNFFIDLPFSKSADTFIWGILALSLLTAVNLFSVKWFGDIESLMAIAKIFAIAVFVVCAVGIWLGVVNGQSDPFGNRPEGGFIGLSVMLDGDGSVLEKLFPKGGFIVITYMIWTLVNFQGSEIVGLSAAETQDPGKNIPKACQDVAYRIILIFLIPVLLVTLLLPYREASLDVPIFAQTLRAYGLSWFAGAFTFVTLIAAFSCANSGLYGTVRSMYGLSVEDLAPKFLSNLNRFDVPQNATLFTIIPIWFVFLLGYASEVLGLWGEAGLPLYMNLIGISGFSGTLCWVGILWSQIAFRRKLARRGYDPGTALTVKAKWYPGLAYASIVIQLAAMVTLFFEDGGASVVVISSVTIVVPVAIYLIQKKRGKVRTVIALGEDEIEFDEKYPEIVSK